MKLKPVFARFLLLGRRKVFSRERFERAITGNGFKVEQLHSTNSFTKLFLENIRTEKIIFLLHSFSTGCNFGNAAAGKRVLHLFPVEDADGALTAAIERLN